MSISAGSRRVLMYPLNADAGDNPYQRMIYSHFPQDWQISRLCELKPFQSADILHFHWPEFLLSRPVIRKNPTLRALVEKNIIATIRRVRSAGGVIAWTAHNLKPHEAPDPQIAMATSRIWSAIASELDIAFAMSASHLPLLAASYPEVTCRWIVAEHPHLREAYIELSPEKKLEVRDEHGIAHKDIVFSTIGKVRSYKQIPGIVDAFNASSLVNATLVVAGECLDPDLNRYLTSISKINSRIKFIQKVLTNHELSRLLNITDISVFNFSSILNSGSMLSALSLGNGILARRSSTSVELRDAIPDSQFMLFDQVIGPEAFQRCAAEFRSVRVPDLSRFDPNRISHIHQEAYLAALAHNKT